MAKANITDQIGKGNAGLSEIAKGVKQALSAQITVLAGAAADTKMNVAGMEVGDEIVSAVVSTDAGGALADDKANMTIQPTGATGTITVAGVLDADTAIVAGVTYTFKNTPTLATHVKRTAGNDNANATALRDTINKYPFRFGGTQRQDVKATASTNVVTVTSTKAGTAGNAQTLTSINGTRLAVTGAGTLTGGTGTGGVKSTTNLTGKSVMLFWRDLT